jgi:hypothetical protein
MVTYKGNYFIRGAENKDISWHEKIKTWQEAFIGNRLDGYNWESYKENRFSIHMISKAEKIYKCTCGVGIAKNACKHVILLMVKDGLLTFPPEVTAKKLDEKRKRGRPAKVSQALLK